MKLRLVEHLRCLAKIPREYDATILEMPVQSHYPSAQGTRERATPGSSVPCINFPYPLPTPPHHLHPYLRPQAPHRTSEFLPNSRTRSCPLLPRLLGLRIRLGSLYIDRNGYTHDGEDDEDPDDEVGDEDGVRLDGCEGVWGEDWFEEFPGHSWCLLQVAGVGS